MNFINYGHKQSVQQPAAKPAPVAPAKVEMAESTQEVLNEEKIVLTEEDTTAEVVEKVKKSKKLHAKVEEGGKKVRVKRVLKD
jgi:hypothetical protein